MINRNGISILGAAIFAASALGCASASVKSNKSSEYTKKLERTLIVFPLDERMQPYEQPFHDRMTAELQKRGVASTFAKIGGQLDLTDATPLDKQAADFNASTTLIIRRAGGVVNSSGDILSARFDAQIFDLATKARVWRASIDYNAGGSLNSTSQRVEALVGELLKALANDGLL
jgi:hypothetical protein